MQYAIVPTCSSYEDTTDDSIDGDEVCCPICMGAFSPLVDCCPDDGARMIRWRARPDQRIGMVIDGRYRIVGRLGAGAMAVVYRGIQLAAGRPVAIKLIHDQVFLDRTAAKRFLREARLLVSLSHRQIVEVFDFGQTEDGSLYLVMELLGGTTLADALERSGPFDVRRACYVGVQLCDALAAAHAHGIVHRDLKPANIIHADPVLDRVKVVDFGLAKSLAGADGMTTLTETGAIMGTPLYMSPEAAHGAAVGPPTDLYSLGCILYEMLVGAPPFSDASITVMLAQHVAAPPPPLPAAVPAAVREVIAAMLAKSPADRPTAAAVRATLSAALDASNHDPEFDERPTIVNLVGTVSRASRAPTAIMPCPPTLLVPSLVGLAIVLATLVVGLFARFVAA